MKIKKANNGTVFISSRCMDYGSVVNVLIENQLRPQIFGRTWNGGLYSRGRI